MFKKEINNLYVNCSLAWHWAIVCVEWIVQTSDCDKEIIWTNALLSMSEIGVDVAKVASKTIRTTKSVKILSTEAMFTIIKKWKNLINRIVVELYI